MVILDTTYPNNHIKIGQNQHDNDNLVKTENRKSLWFHLLDYPSCHIILEHNDSSEFTKEMIYYCARALISRSKYKSTPKIKVMYCTLDNVRPTKVIGQVTTTSYNTIKMN